MPENDPETSAGDDRIDLKKAKRRRRLRLWRPESALRLFITRAVNPEKWSLRGRFVWASGALLVVGMLTIFVFVWFFMNRMLAQELDERLKLFDHWLEHAVQVERSRLLEDAAGVAAMQVVIDALAEDDSERLQQAMLPYNERVRLSTGRSPAPLRFFRTGAGPFFSSLSAGGGESEAGAMVLASQKDMRAFAGLEMRAEGPAVGAAVPVVRGGEQVGTVFASLPLAEVFRRMDLPVEFGLAVALDAGAYPDQAQHGRRMGGAVVVEQLGNTTLTGMAARHLEMDGKPSRLRDHAILAVPLENYLGRDMGAALLFYDATQQYVARDDRLFLFAWLLVSGAAFLWLLLYINVKRIKDFLDRMKKIIIASHSNEFADRFESDSVHCLEVLNCRNTECPVWKDPSRVCYLETGSAAISPKWRDTCIFLNKYEKCENCPVYRMRHGDELMEMRHVVNTMMGLWGQFLGRIGGFLAEVFHARGARGRLPSLDEVSGYLEHMASLTRFGHDLQGVYDQDEVYRQLEHVFETRFGLHRFNLLVVNSSEDRFEAAIDRADLGPEHQDVLLNCELCRAKRVSEDVISEDNPALCPYFGVNHETEVRCCLPMVMGGRVGAVFTFAVSRPEWENKRRNYEVIKKYLDETAPVLSSLKLLRMSKDQALRDPMTQCHNRRFLDEYLAQFEHLSERHGKRMGFIMADMDHFKMVNDTYGHEAGDQVLKALVGIIRESIRRSDLLIRYGGEEFLILLMEPAQEGASFAVAEKIRQAVEEAQLPLPNGQIIKKTISMGVAEYPEDADQLYKAIKFADVALYAAKAAGRNRTLRFTPEMWEDETY